MEGERKLKFLHLRTGEVCRLMMEKNHQPVVTNYRFKNSSSNEWGEKSVLE